MGNAQLPAKSAYSSLVTKIWRLNLGSVLEGNPAVCTIILRHHRRSGEKIVIVDGKEVHRSRDLLDSGGIVLFEAAGRDCTITVVDYPGLNSYELRVSGQRVASEAERIDHPQHTHTPPRGTKDEDEEDEGGALMGGSAGEAEGRPIRITVPSTVEQDGAMFFVIRSEVGGGGGGPIEVKRRFHDLDDLDHKVRSYFYQHHLLSSLPPLPPKFLKPLVNHKDPAFLAARQDTLQCYLNKLWCFPHLGWRNPDLLEFLGLSSPLPPPPSSPPPSGSA